MRIRLLCLGAFATVALAACGGNGGQTTQGSQTAAATAGQTGTASASPQSQTQTAAATTTSSAADTTTAAQSSAAQPNGGAGVTGPANQCKAAGLALSYLGGQGATGHGELGFALKNTGSVCSTAGYPGVQFLARDGAALPTTPQHTTSDFFGDLPVQHLSLAPGQSASFRLGVSHGGGSDAGCSTAYGLQVIAPNDTATLRVPIPNGASECGATTVSPLQPGDSAYQ
ncbi:MAG TPA: DUF4232 domain-containing protein [Solirubrobacteraceae bacterium]|jgi:hypothetical protein